MMGTQYYVRFAQTYGQSNYGACNYNDSTSCSTGGGTNSGSGSPGTLSNTGLMVAVIVTVACLIAFVALVVRFWRRPSQAAPESEQADDAQAHAGPPSSAV